MTENRKRSSTKGLNFVQFGWCWAIPSFVTSGFSLTGTSEQIGFRTVRASACHPNAADDLLLRGRRMSTSFCHRTFEYLHKVQGPGTFQQLLFQVEDPHSDKKNRPVSEYCQKVYWTTLVQDGHLPNGQNDHFGQNDLIIPN